MMPTMKQRMTKLCKPKQYKRLSSILYTPWRVSQAQGKYVSRPVPRLRVRGSESGAHGPTSPACTPGAEGPPVSCDTPERLALHVIRLWGLIFLSICESFVCRKAREGNLYKGIGQRPLSPFLRGLSLLLLVTHLAAHFRFTPIYISQDAYNKLKDPSALVFRCFGTICFDTQA